MALDLENVEGGVGIFAENGDARVASVIAGTGIPDGVSGFQQQVEIGSLYLRGGTNETYRKIANAGAPADWELIGSSATIGNWRPERVDAHTGQVLAAGVTDPTAWVDNDGGFDGTLATIGNYVLDGNCDLWEITAIGGATSITLAAAANPPVADDMFAVRYNLPDPAGQENQAIITYDGSGCIKVADVDFGSATGVTLVAPYNPINGDPMAGDSVQIAIEKLDGNQDDIQSTLGVAQGDVDLGTFTGVTIPDNSTVKDAFQSLETAYEETDQNVDDLITLSGVPENSTDLGTFPGNVISDNVNNKTAMTELEAAIEDISLKSSGTIAQATPTIVDSVSVDEFQIATWTLVARDVANPDRVRRQTIQALHNGHAAADASSTDRNVIERLSIGNVNVQVAMVLNGAGAGQTMDLQITTNEASGIEYTIERNNFLPLAG